MVKTIARQHEKRKLLDVECTEEKRKKMRKKYTSAIDTTWTMLTIPGIQVLNDNLGSD